MDAASGLCIGCGRTLDEIARWGAMTDEERRKIMARLPQRLGHVRHLSADDGSKA